MTEVPFPSYVETPCIEFEGHIMPNGYGQKFHGRGRTTLAHRYALEEHLGRVLARDEVVIHMCDNRSCVNVEHLYAGTHKQNVADMFRKGRDPDRTQTHCSSCGQEYGDPYVYPDGRKKNRCWPCYEAAQQRHRVKQNASYSPEKRRAAYEEKKHKEGIPNKGRDWSETCSKGHDLSVAGYSERIDSRGRIERRCVQCRRDRQRVAYERRKSAQGSANLPFTPKNSE